MYEVRIAFNRRRTRSLTALAREPRETQKKRTKDDFFACGFFLSGAPEFLLYVPMRFVTSSFRALNATALGTKEKGHKQRVHDTQMHSLAYKLSGKFNFATIYSSFDLISFNIGNSIGLCYSVTS